MTELTAREQAFVEAYRGNGTEAARAAGYSGNEKVLGVTASRLLRRARVQQALEARRRLVETDVSAEVARTVGKVAPRAERQAFWSAVMADPGATMSDRLKASELLGKSQGDFVQRHKVEGPMRLEVINPFAKPPA